MTGDAQGTDGIMGSVIGGRFRIDRDLGSGGMADVFAAHDLATRRSVAVKLLKKDVANNPEAVERLRREGEVLKKLEHPAIVRLETFGKLEDGRLFIAMELLEGETLGERIRRRGKLEPAELSPIVAGACAALGAAHGAGIVHRDLKPDNVFLEQGPDGPRVKLLDFGISKITGSDKLTQTGEVLGTPRYMAPEQLSAERDLDRRTDVYALGVMLYEALAGSPPFLASTPTDLIVAILHGKVAPLRSFRPDLSEAVEAVVARAMSRAREARQETAAELADAWLAAAGAADRSGPRAPARAGMETAPLGSLGDAVVREIMAHEARNAARSAADPERKPAPAPENGSETYPAASNGDDASQEDLRPGTFSALAAAEAPIATPVVPESIDPIAPTDPGPARRAPTERVTVASRREPISASAPVSPAGRRREPTQPYRLPTKNGRTLLVAGALIAGALSATLAIVALKMLSSDEEPGSAESAFAHRGTALADAPPSAAPGGPTVDVAAGAEEQDAEGPSFPRGLEAPVAEAATDTGASSSPVTAPEPAEEDARDRRPRRRARAEPGRTSEARGASQPAEAPRADPTAPAAAPSAPAAAAPQGPAELMREARAALRRGEARACVDLVDRAMDAGAGSLALRLRGDCLVRLGDRAEGLKAYERFCIIARDHPAIGEVRALVESLGGRCD